jgi:thiol-disulfide isomerase/thioredoxin
MRYAIITILFIAVIGPAKGQKIKYLKNRNGINSTTQLFDKLKGRPIFLDLWAPWCDPCKEEFKYSDTLYRELKKRNIQLLYLSLNTRVAEPEWKAAIKQYHLKGIHTLANKDLENSVTKMIWGAPGGFSIPRYLLIGRNGKVLLNDALPPDHGKQLFMQIDSALRKSN